MPKLRWFPWINVKKKELTSADTLWLHVRSMGQWTNRLYEYFRQPESQMVSSKRLSTSLRKHRQLLKAQVLRASPDLI